MSVPSPDEPESPAILEALELEVRLEAEPAAEERVEIELAAPPAEPAPAIELAAMPVEPDDVAVADTAPPVVFDPGEPRADPVLEAVRTLDAGLRSRLEALQAAFDREVRAEATREKIVDRLHAELQEYKSDLLLNTLRPVFVDLIQLHDDIGKIVETQDPADEPVARLVGFMRGFQQGIEDILYRQGVEPYRVEAEAFDPRRQRAVGTVPTDEPGRARTVAARLRSGFRSGERVIRPELVSVYALPRAAARD